MKRIPRYSLMILVGLILRQLAWSQEFDVASIKQSLPDQIFNSSPYPGGKYSAKGITLNLLIKVAFGTHDLDISHVPGWVEAEQFDIEARPAHPMSWGDTKLALQHLLKDRFQLSTHMSNQTRPGYALELSSKRDSKLARAAPRGETEKWGFIGTNGKLVGRDVSLRELADRLGLIMHGPVQDQTGLPGRVDFTLEWDSRTMDYTSSGLSASGQDQPSLYSALSAQLGLKLVRKQINQPFLVVDHIEHPSPN